MIKRRSWQVESRRALNRFNQNVARQRQSHALPSLSTSSRYSTRTQQLKGMWTAREKEENHKVDWWMHLQLKGILKIGLYRDYTIGLKTLTERIESRLFKRCGWNDGRFGDGHELASLRSNWQRATLGRAKWRRGWGVTSSCSVCNLSKLEISRMVGNRDRWLYPVG